MALFILNLFPPPPFFAHVAYLHPFPPGSYIPRILPGSPFGPAVFYDPRSGFFYFLVYLVCLPFLPASHDRIGDLVGAL